MQSIILGIMVTHQPTTTLTIELPELDASAVARILRGGDGEYAQMVGNGQTFQMSLAPGQYVLVLDSALRPSTLRPFTVATDADAQFWSVAHPDAGGDPRPWRVCTGRSASATDPKDPWPPLPASSPPSEAALALGSFIASTLGDLLTTNVGRGAAVIPSRQPQRSSAIDRARDL